MKKKPKKKKKKKYKKKTKPTKFLPKITIRRLVKAIEDSYGSKHVIAEKLGRNYVAMYRALTKAPQWVKDIYDKENERVMEVFEETVVEMAQQRLHFPTALNAAKFGLTHHPKSEKKGYKKRSEVTLQGGDKPLQIQNENLVSLEKLKSLPIAVRKQMLEEMAEKEEKEEDE